MITTQTTSSHAVTMLGKPVADEIDARLAREVPEFTAAHKIVPNLAIVQVGHNAASERYIKKKIEACAKLHMRAELNMFPEEISADDLKDEVACLTRSNEVHGVAFHHFFGDPGKQHQSPNARRETRQQDSRYESHRLRRLFRIVKIKLCDRHLLPHTAARVLAGTISATRESSFPSSAELSCRGYLATASR